jgi:hypothetical protein
MAGLGRGRKITQAKKAPEAIEKAALLLEEKGWCTGTTTRRRAARRHEDRYCMGGALLQGRGRRLGSGLWWLWARWRPRSGYFSASDYNDSQTDKRKVIRFMRRVAKQMRGAKS